MHLIRQEQKILKTKNNFAIIFSNFDVKIAGNSILFMVSNIF